MIEEAIKNLKEHQRQLDADGCHVGVSRQALEEVLAYVDSIRDNAPLTQPISCLTRKGFLW